MPVTAAVLTSKLNEALQRGWKEFPDHPNYHLIKDLFDELAQAKFFEQKFRGKIANPAHDFAVKTMSIHVNQVLAQYGVVLTDFYPGDFGTSTGQEITDDPSVGLYEHRNFYNQAWIDGKLAFDITITIRHIRGQFKFPKPPFVTITKEY